jgi:hypothetical protein
MPRSVTTSPCRSTGSSSNRSSSTTDSPALSPASSRVVGALNDPSRRVVAPASGCR